MAYSESLALRIRQIAARRRGITVRRERRVSET